MEQEFYICEFCQSQFKPKRRKAQKFCSTTCRVKNHHHKNKPTKKVPDFPSTNHSKDELPKVPNPTTIDQMSFSGVGNAATGTLIIQLLTKLLTKLENKHATKKDIEELKNILKKRYFQIQGQGVEQRYDGTIPFFDMATCTIVYFKDPNYRNPVFNMM